MKKALLIMGLLAGLNGLLAQKSDDFGIVMGTSMYHLNSILPVPFSKTPVPAAGLYYRYNFNPRYAVRGGLNMAFGNNPVPEMDLYGLVEFNFHALSSKIGKTRVSPYMATGISYLMNFELFDQASGQVANDPAFSIGEFFVRNTTIPFNLGVRYNPTERLTMAVEWAIRKTIQINWKEIENKQLSNWQSMVGVTVGYRFDRTCPTCPFYETARKKRR